ncbi:copper homeostasis protein CutC [Pontibacillus yanchengensis]|uniref:Copper homeostasis protein CutC n=2 Tax=Pontibacillus yanchengensis TaxID=462910 RepID=A0ACC7VDK8_9BACI|nr:copper homeostasis protein CutC [Pontibacillus yanchengensis]MYL32100.1 copper homeostasis protein CutC [Pontibacillus yanchengensis]MYL52680.1 copper homeostasis protein CutC [Pontibacillus yanchengensis]
MLLECIVQNKQEAKEAEKLGVDRVELVSAMQEGGLTPSYGTIKQVLESVDIPVQVMIRPHSYGYVYNEEDFQVICEDIRAIQELGGNRIVFGALHEDFTINEKMLQEFITRFPDLNITFHRAFDEIASQEEAYKTLSKYHSNVKQILTSGGASNCEEGKEELAKLVHLSREHDGPIIMPGGGMKPSNLGRVHHVAGAEAYHFGKSVRMDNSFANGLDAEVVKGLLENTQDR